MERLNGVDTAFLCAEAAGMPFHLAALSILDTSVCPAPIDEARVRALFAERLALLPVYRHRLVRVPLGLGPPVWVEDPDVDVAEHVHGTKAAPPGDERAVGDVVDAVCATPLDLTRPLWQKWVIDGLEGGRVGILDRLHHAAVDGIRGIEVQVATYDLVPSPPPRTGDLAGAGTRVPLRVELLADAAARLAMTPVRAVTAAGHVARLAARTAGLRRRGGIDRLAVPFTAPRTSFNRAVGGRRAFAYRSLPLDPVLALARRQGVTVNDVVLSLAGGALRRYLEARGELPAHPLSAVVPVGLLGDPTRTVRGNHVSFTVASLGTDVADPKDRLHAVAASAKAGKALFSSMEPDLLRELASLSPPAALQLLLAAYARSHLANLHPTIVNAVVSNVRGSPCPLYFAGAPLLATYGFGPIFDGAGVNVTVLSYVGSLDFGVTVCPDLVPDPWLIVDGIQAEASALRLCRPGRRATA